MGRWKALVLLLLAAALVAAGITVAVKTRQDADALMHRAADNLTNAQASAPQAAEPALSNAKTGWGPGTHRNEKNQTTDSIAAQESYGEYGGYFIFPEDEGTLYLTFDLGYENGYTEPILDALDARDVKATFFVTMDYVREAPHIVQRIIDSGHTLANHTVHHPSIPDLDAERITAEVMNLHDYVLETFGYEMTLFRNPMGEFSPRSMAHINSLGYKSIFWSFAYKDWVTDNQPDPDAALEKLTDALHPGGIYLLHAVSATNAAIMGDFLDAADAAGYTFGRIDVRLGLVPPPAEEILP